MRRFCSRHRLTIAALILGVVAFWAFGSTLHAHSPFGVERNCPGCQLERTPGCNTLVLLAALFVPLLVLLYAVCSTIHLPAATHLSFLPRSLRSPPVAP